MSHTRIGADELIVGAIRAGEDMTISGRVKGRIDSEGLVIVEAGAIVEADLFAREVVVRGLVIGEISAVELLEVTANGQVAGRVQTRQLKLHAGGRIAGEVSTDQALQGFHFGHKRGSTEASLLRARVSAPARVERRTSFSARPSRGGSSTRTSPPPATTFTPAARSIPAPTPTRAPSPPAEPEVHGAAGWLTSNLADDLPLLRDEASPAEISTPGHVSPVDPLVGETVEPHEDASVGQDEASALHGERVEAPEEVVESDAAPEQSEAF